MSKQYTTNRTEIPVTILTDYEYKQGDTIERVRQEIEQSGFHLQTLFNNLKRSALFMENHFSDAEGDHIRGFCSDLMNTADIGNALAMAIWKSISDLTKIQMNSDAPNEIEKPEIETPEIESSDAETLAEKISYLINSSDVPPPIADGVADVMQDFFNEHIDQTEFNDESHTPEYLARVLKNSLFFTIDGEKTEDESDENM